jgi:hypothetical protein
MEFLSQVNIYLMAGVLTTLCPPALIYIIYATTQIGIDTARGEYNTAFLKFWVAIIFTVLLNHLCQSGLGIISWIIVFIPFILMTFIVALLLLVFGLDPKTGKITKGDKESGGGGGKHHNPIGPDGQHYHNLKHSHAGEEDVEDQRSGIKRMTNVTYNPKTKQFTIGGSSDGDPRYDIDSPDNTGRKTNEQKIADRAAADVQAQGKKRNAGYKFFSEFPTMQKYQNNTLKRREFVRIIRNVLVDMGETDRAAQFYNQSGASVAMSSDEEFEASIKNLTKNYKNLMGPRKKGLFQKQLVEKGIFAN